MEAKLVHQVFISYSSKDKIVGDAACAYLEQRGIGCWIAPRDIVPGMDWGEAIVDGITGAQVFVLVFSTNANESPQVRREIERAVHHGLAVIPFRIEDVLPVKSLEYFMSVAHWLDALHPPLDDHFAHLARVVEGLLRGNPAPSPDKMPAPAFLQNTFPRHDNRTLIRTAAITAILAAILLLASVLGLDPPWPRGIGYLSVASIVAAPFAHQKWAVSPTSSGMHMRREFACALIAGGLLAFMILSSLFIETIPLSGVRVVKGFVCTADALTVYAKQCPDLPREALRDAEWESIVLWTRWSVTLVRLSLVLTWLAFVAGLALIAISVQRRR